jgi:hypothetical protein
VPRAGRQFHVGQKPAYELFPRPLVERMKARRKTVRVPHALSARFCFSAPPDAILGSNSRRSTREQWPTFSGRRRLPYVRQRARCTIDPLLAAQEANPSEKAEAKLAAELVRDLRLSARQCPLVTSCARLRARTRS